MQLECQDNLLNQQTLRFCRIPTFQESQFFRKLDEQHRSDLMCRCNEGQRRKKCRVDAETMS